MRFLAILLVLALTGCAERSHAPGMARAKHDFHAPHAGTIVRLGREEFHLEFVRDAAAGRLTAYVLDAQSQEATRIRADSFELVAVVGGEKRPLTFQAAPVTAEGETIGASSRFETQADWLKTTGSFEAELPRLKIFNTTFLRVPFTFPQGNEHP